MLAEVAAELARTGEPDRAVALAHTITDSAARDTMLGQLAVIIVQAGDLDRAEALARTITDPYAQAQALAEVAVGLARIGEPDRAVALAHTITDSAARDTALRQLERATQQATPPGSTQEPRAAASLLATVVKSSHLAGRLYDRLADRFGEGQVFIDVDTIEPGVDFAEEISRAVATCKVLLAIIGPNWLTATDEQVRRRLDDPNDIVRLEIETALARDVRVIPILVEGAAMPGRQELPESLAGPARRNALPIRHESFRADAERLITALERALAPALDTTAAADLFFVPMLGKAAAGIPVLDAGDEVDNLPVPGLPLRRCFRGEGEGGRDGGGRCR